MFVTFSSLMYFIAVFSFHLHGFGYSFVIAPFETFFMSLNKYFLSNSFASVVLRIKIFAPFIEHWTVVKEILYIETF